jgi:hypothetical protein
MTLPQPSREADNPQRIKETPEMAAARLERTKRTIIFIMRRDKRITDDLTDDEAMSIMGTEGIRAFELRFPVVPLPPEPPPIETHAPVEDDEFDDLPKKKKVPVEVREPEKPAPIRIVQRLKHFLFGNKAAPEGNHLHHLSFIVNTSRKPVHCAECDSLVTAPPETETNPQIVPALVIRVRDTVLCLPCVELVLGKPIYVLCREFASNWRRLQMVQASAQESRRRAAEQNREEAAREAAQAEKDNQAAKLEEAKRRAMERITQEELARM